MSRPHVTLKLASSLDGKIATASGESRWITGPEARAEVHRLREQVDAVMVGSGTVRADDPELTARLDDPPERQPLRVVVSSAMDIDLKSRLVRTLDKAPLLVIGDDSASDARRDALEAAGVRTAAVERGQGGLDIKAVLTLLAGHRVASVLAEGGGRLAASLVAAGAVDRVEWFRAPVILGAEGEPSIAALALARLADAPRFRRVALRELGSDIWESYERA